MFKYKHFDIVCSQDLDNMIELFQSTSNKIIASAFDTETTGLHIIYDKPFLFQFGWCTTDGIGYTFIVDLEQTPQLATRTITVWNTLAAQTSIYLGHNVKFDLNMLHNIGLPYTANNVSDTMFWIRWSSDAVQEKYGGAPLGLKAFAQRYVNISARDMDKKLKEERTQIAKNYNNKLKKRMHWTTKQVDEFFKDKLVTAEDLPPALQKVYNDWLTLDLPLYLQHKVRGRVESEDIPYNKLNRANVHYYGHLDVVWTLETYMKCKEPAEYRHNINTIKMEENLIYPLIRMERIGFKIDYQYLCQAEKDIKVYTLQRRKDLSVLAGRTVKVSQSAVLLDILQNTFDLDVTTTNADILSRVCSDLKRSGENPQAVDFIETLQELRTLEKWYSTYIIRFMNNYRPEDGKLYTDFKQTGTVSGRSSSDFQQFPKDNIVTIDGRVLFSPRQLVLAQDEDFKAIVYLDYSQIELRLQAFYTILVGHPDLNLCRAYMPYKCHKMDGTPFETTNRECIIHAYDMDWFYDEKPKELWTPTDVHGATTELAFHVTREDESFHALRYKGKRVNFAKNYGAQYSKIKEMFPEYTDAECHVIDDAYYKAFPGVKAYHEYCYKMAESQPYIENLFGGRYYGTSGHKLINLLVQGTGAYYLKWKIVQVDQYLREHHCKSQLMMQIHDELQFKMHKDDDPQIFFDIKHIMEDWEDTQVPIIADMEVTTTNWAEKYEVETIEEFYGKVTDGKE